MAITYAEYLAVISETEGAVPIDEAAFNALSEEEKNQVTGGRFLVATVAQLATNFVALGAAAVAKSMLFNNTGPTDPQSVNIDFGNAASRVGASKVLKTVRDSAFEAGKQFINAKLNNASEGGGAKPPSRRNRNGGNTNNPNDYTGAAPASPNKSVAINTFKPTPVSLSTGIPLNAYADFWPKASIGYRPLILSACRLDLTIPDASSGGQSNQMKVNWDIISSLIYANAQKVVKFKLDPAFFTAKALSDYFGTLGRALQFYYFYASVIEYNKVCKNSNPAMIDLEVAVSNAEIDLLRQLGSLICAYPVPPNMAIFCNYIMSTYATSELPNSTLVKFIPFHIGNLPGQEYWDKLINNSFISKVISDLEKQREIAGVLSRIYPDWTGFGLDTPAAIPLYDPNFMTLWYNSPYVYKGNRYPRAAIDEVTDYFTATNYLDGAMVGLFEMWNPSATQDYPGIFQTIGSTLKFSDGTAGGVNRYIYAPTSAGIGRFINFYTNGFSMDGYFANSISKDGTGNQAIAPVGSMPVRGLTPRVIQDTTGRFLNWLLHVDQIC